ncbi:MAG: Glycosyl transferase group 1 [Parcubacteria group bacterium GW2011_GWC1_45_14]|nr:MAG: Glycosyl transferase group 1 [Parcubacteria group bacterium GW2011_GWC1_45_14]
MNIFKKRIKVAMIAPSFGDIGGPEVVTQNLTDALLELGVDVTLFAPADWKTKAKHIRSLKKSLWNMDGMSDMESGIIRNYRISAQVKILKHQQDFDIIHLHSHKYAYAVAENLDKPCVISFHNRFSKEALEQIKETGAYTVALSESQKRGMEVSEVIHNGVPTGKIEHSLDKGGYLMFVGRLADQKGVDTAIEIAKKAQKKLLIFGRKGNSEERQVFFDEKISPFLDEENIIYKGEVSHSEIYDYLRGAEALLFPIKRPEVFGMVAAEALACGTPVIGTTTDPLPEILRNEKVAFLSDDLEKLVEAAKNTDRFDRKECRKYAEENFDSLVMAKKYLELYEEILGKK